MSGRTIVIARGTAAAARAQRSRAIAGLVLATTHATTIAHTLTRRPQIHLSSHRPLPQLRRRPHQPHQPHTCRHKLAMVAPPAKRSQPCKNVRPPQLRWASTTTWPRLSGKIIIRRTATSSPVILRRDVSISTFHIREFQALPRVRTMAATAFAAHRRCHRRRLYRRWYLSHHRPRRVHLHAHQCPLTSTQISPGACSRRIPTGAGAGAPSTRAPI